jgi:hypothetical protein
MQGGAKAKKHGHANDAMHDKAMHGNAMQGSAMQGGATQSDNGAHH